VTPVFVAWDIIMLNDESLCALPLSCVTAMGRRGRLGAYTFHPFGISHPLHLASFGIGTIHCIWLWASAGNNANATICLYFVTATSLLYAGRVRRH
jgi:hypothetical protein